MPPASNYFLRWRILARIRRFLRPIFRLPFPVFLVPTDAVLPRFHDLEVFGPPSPPVSSLKNPASLSGYQKNTGSGNYKCRHPWNCLSCARPETQCAQSGKLSAGTKNYAYRAIATRFPAVGRSESVSAARWDRRACGQNSGSRRFE